MLVKIFCLFTTCEVDKYFKILLLHAIYVYISWIIVTFPLVLVNCSSVLIRLWTHSFPVLYIFSCYFPHTESPCLTLPTQYSFILQALLISSVYNNRSLPMLLTDSFIPELLYQLTTPKYSALNNLLILPFNCLTCGILILFTKWLLPWEKRPYSVRMSKWAPRTWDTQIYQFCCFRLSTIQGCFSHPPISNSV